jgi:hypothetical protein
MILPSYIHPEAGVYDSIPALEQVHERKKMISILVVDSDSGIVGFEVVEKD